MASETSIPEHIQSLLDRADLSLLRGKHGEASTLFWKATEAAIGQAALAHGHKLHSLGYDDVEPFIDNLEQKTGIPLVSGYLNALEFERNGDGDLMDLEDVVFYEPVIHSFIARLLDGCLMTLQPDHYALSLRCRRKAEQELEQNDLLTAAEMMWGAVVHAIEHIAPRITSARLNSHRDIKQVVPVLDASLPGVDLREEFGNAEVLPRYFYRVHLAAHLVRNSFRRCQRLLDALLV